MAKSNTQIAFEAYLMEHGECDEETFKKLQGIFESGEDDDDDDKDSEDKGDDSAESKDDGEDDLDLDDDTKDVYEQFKKLTKDQQKQFCQAQRTEKLYQEFAELSEEDQQCIRESVGTDIDDLTTEQFLDMMEAAIDAVNTVNAGTYTTESADDLDNFDFLK